MTTVVHNSEAAVSPGGEPPRPLVKVTKRKGVKVPTDSTAIVVAPPDATQVARLAQITDEIIQSNSTAIRAMFGVMYRTGLLLKEVEEKKLFEDGGYKTFGQYIQMFVSEHDLSEGYLYKTLKVAKEFTEEDVKSVGPKKLQVILEAKPEKRQNLLNQAKRGASRRTLEDQIREDNNPEKFSQAKAPTVEPEAPKEQTVVTPQRKKLLLSVEEDAVVAYQLIDRATKDEASLESLKDGMAIAKVAFENGSEMMLAVYTEESGKLKVKLAFRRSK